VIAFFSELNFPLMRHFLCILLLFCLTISAETWTERRAALFQQAKDKAEQQAAELVPPKSVLKELGLTDIPKPVTMSLKEAEASVQPLVKERLDKEFPDSFFEALEAKAAEKFPLAEIGEKISVRSILPNAQPVTGKLLKRDDKRLLIGSKWMLFQDLPAEAVIFLKPEENQAQRNKWIETEKMIFIKSRSSQASALQKEIKQKVMEEAGYVFVQDDDEETASWHSADQIFQDTLAARRKASFDSIYPEILQRTMQDNGFRYMKTMQEWRPEKGDGAPGFWQRTKEKFN